jgi:hypothetical protein
MQTVGYMNLRGTGKGFQAPVLVLVRQGDYGRYIKIRKSGKKGTHFTDEEIFINQEVEQGDVDRLVRLLEGETIFC